MNLKQYTRQKRRNPLILILSIGLTLFLVFTMVKKLKPSENKTDANTQIILTSNIKNLPDTIFPLILMKDNEIIKIYSSQLPKDTTFIWKLQDGINSFKMLDKKYTVRYYDSVFYKKEKVIFVNLKLTAKTSIPK